MKRKQPSTTTIRLTPAGKQSLHKLTAASGYSANAVITRAIIVLDATLTHDSATVQKHTDQMDMAARTLRIRQDAEDRIKALKNHKGAH